MEEELRQEAEGYFETSCPYSYADTEDDLKHDVTEAYMAGAEPREKLIKELEKENAELKEKLKPENCLKLLAKEGYIKFTSDQLTKAKEIIKGLLIILYEIATDEYDFEKACPYQYKEARDFLEGE